MPITNQSSAMSNIATSKQNTGDYETITQNVLHTPDDAIKLSISNGNNAALTTRVDKHDGVPKTQLAYINQNKEDRNLDLAEIVDFPKAHRHPAVTFHALQEWEGYITEVNDMEFTANLIDLTAGASYEKEEAVIPFDEISENDSSKMHVGSIFRWVIGYERSAAGTKKRVSHIVLRDLPAITSTDLQAGENWARKIMEAFSF